MNKPIPNSIAAMAAELTEWRRDIHAHPELGYEETRTAGVVAEKLKSFGFDVIETGVGKTGVVGVLHGADGPAGSAEDRILVRADMDALPMEERTGLPYASRNPGRMHACGHDGHTTMLPGAAKHLAETRNFKGSVVFVFQPAEE
ncbi:MAG: M20/M25/M40 family metallo-hydrolase, partial [Pseudomonadota bacterium]